MLVSISFWLVIPAKRPQIEQLLSLNLEIKTNTAYPYSLERNQNRISKERELSSELSHHVLPRAR